MENIFKRIERLEKQREAILKELDQLREYGREDLVQKVRDTKLKEIDKKIAKKYEEYANSLDKKYGEKVFTLSDIFSMDIPEQQWLIENLIPAQGITAISGVPGSYKSFLSLVIAKCIYKQEALFGEFSIEQGVSLIIDMENNFRTIRERLRLVGFDDSADIYYWKGDFSIDKDDCLRKLTTAIEKRKIGLVIFDSLVRIHNKDENDAGEMSQVLKRMKELNDLGATVIFLHHSRKSSFMNRGNAGETMRGSSDILAAIDAHLLLEKIDTGLKIKQTKLRQAQPVDTFSVRINSDENFFDFEYVGVVEESLDKVTKAREKIVELLKDGRRERQDIIEGLSSLCGSTTTDKAIKGLYAESIIKKQVGENGKHVYFLPKEDKQEKLV